MILFFMVLRVVVECGREMRARNVTSVPHDRLQGHAVPRAGRQRQSDGADDDRGCN
jgi:hypothetical protein